MRRAAALTALASVLLAAGAVLLLGGDDEDGENARSPRSAERPPPRCPVPRVTSVEARRAGVNPLRVEFRVRAEADRGGLGAIFTRFGAGGAAISDLSGPRRVSMDIAHTYPRPGTYTASVVAESVIPGCRRYQKSKPARLRVRVPAD